MKQESNILKNNNDISAEISDDIEVVGLGRILSEAREAMGLSQQQVADKLNFRTTLVEKIEAEDFDLNLPAAFNRGYLKNYAKLVNVSQDDVLNSYEQLGVAQRQCAEMQSFSKGTEKQAENNMLMWITYLILIALTTATVVWWYQTPSTQPTSVSVQSVNEIGDTSVNNSVSNNVTKQNETDNIEAGDSQIIDKPSTLVTGNNKKLAAPSLNGEQNNKFVDEAFLNTSNKEAVNSSVESLSNLELMSGESAVSIQNTLVNTEQASTEQESAVVLANLVFTFSGDCWVNIYDATGERVAWGVKKSGYIMRFSGQAPFNVTLGKPELVEIEYNDAAVDMTGFNVGNIARFSLPLKP